MRDRTSEPLHQAAFEHALDGVVITDDAGTYVEVNDAACELFGRSREDLLGRSAAALATMTDFGGFWRAFLAAGSLSGEVEIRHADGSTRRVEFAARASIAPGRHLAILRDCTARREEQRLAEEQRDLLEQMQEVASIGGWTWDTEADIAVWSDACCRIVGIAPGSIMTLERYLAHVHPDDRAVALEIAQRTINSMDEPFEAENRIVRPDGEVRWVLIRGRRQRGPDGRPTSRLVGIAKDLTDEKRAQDDVRRAEEQLRVAQKLEAIGVLAGGIAHDFNNLLSVILGFTSLALEDEALAADTRENLREVRGATDRAIALTRQLLAFSRRQILEPRPVDLTEVVSGMVPMIRRLVGEAIRIELELATDTAWVVADPGGLEQVVMNLVVNARDAMPDGGTLTIEIREAAAPRACSAQAIREATGPCIELSVRDTGHGFDAATKARIFEPFFTTKPVGKGTGLGLPTAFGIVQQSQGCIDVDSTPGQGSTFRVYLARQQRPGIAATWTEEVPVVPGTETVLLVEDDDQVRALCRKVLKRCGYEVIDAANAGEAVLVTEAHDGEIHLLLTDLVMPRMNGRQLAERLAASRPRMKILYMSGYTDDPVAKTEIAQAGAPFLAKPIDPGALGRKVRHVLDGIVFRTPSLAPRDGGAGDRP